MKETLAGTFPVAVAYLIAVCVTPDTDMMEASRPIMISDLAG